VSTTDVRTCYRHPDRRAGVICQRCDRPICPECMHQASVGFHCPECTKKGAQRVMTARSLVTRPLITTVLVATNLAIFVGNLMSPTVPVSPPIDTLMELAFGGEHRLYAEGALWGPLIEAGDWWRPITGGFLHANLIHVGFNMFLLWQLGSLLEPAVKRWGFGALYLMSLLGGSFLVLVLDNDQITVGASGAVFGLMAATFIAMRSRGINPFQTGIGPLILINLFFTFSVPNISIGGHIGGLVAGGVGGLILWEWGPRLGRSSPVPVIACFAIAGVLFAGCLLVAQPLGA
jgi:membrane associated rhomboid family serine protease